MMCGVRCMIMHALITSVFSIKAVRVITTVAQNVGVEELAVSKAKASASALALSRRFIDEDKNDFPSSDFSGIGWENHRHRYAY